MYAQPLQATSAALHDNVSLLCHDMGTSKVMPTHAKLLRLSGYNTGLRMQVDFVLLGGDLFHDNKPSRTTLVRAMEILSKYCLKPKPIAFKVLSDETKAFVSGYASSPPDALTPPCHQQCPKISET